MSDIARRFAVERFALLPKLVGPELTAFLWSYAHTKLASRQMYAGSDIAPGVPTAYGDAVVDGLLEHLRTTIETATGLRLLPTYGCLRFYGRGAALPRHRDRPACEISVSLNAGQTSSSPWPLHISGPGGVLAARLEPGDGVVYRGVECDHWRDTLTGEGQAQIFLHYVDADGLNAALKYDRRPALMHPPRERPARRPGLREPGASERFSADD